MKIHRVVILTLGVFAVGCASTQRAPDPEVHTSTITASSMPSVYGIQVRLSGSAVVRDDWLYLAVPTGSVRTYQGKAQAWDLIIRAGLVACAGNGKSRMVSESRAARIAPLIGFTRDSSMLDTTTRVFRDTLLLDLGVPRGTNLERAWVAFDISWPIESVLAAYTLNSDVPLQAHGVQQAGRGAADVVCR